MNEPQQKWTETIETHHSLLDLKLKEVWRYKDLIYMFVKRDFISSFKQTILGPIWFFVNPILTTIVYLIVFGKIANLSTDGTPPILFYLAGVTLWNYFSSCLLGTSSTFVGNANMFGKVYFPRLVTPISIVISNLMRLGVQFLLFILGWLYYFSKGEVKPNIWILATPFLIFLMAVFALGVGMIFSSLTTKYKDLTMLLGFGVSLYMYATPVIYPTSALPGIFRKLSFYNPLTGIFECFKYAWFGAGDFSPLMLGISSAIIFLLFMVGIVIFNKIEKSFMDTV
ncbi:MULTISPECIES: ABC transporter permease [Chryseobacterium]|uniref:Transport permease protein n=1 Tax=Chryseobacterium camelliae TaxID=1265445 RepID=A0ABU0TNB8_9FLAO|nr:MULTISPECIES: ABC transporter permease [Chryseobacterium]MDT3407609.1 lipopolysaccharide transport system permease protein [Pseudacidovorax intermedius]MDQ1098539.1 lipopolysaccharide transport system permease protein [Chryseobacterium camelliae]MDQ1102463.1 lipopolysaccharide transport system permease protein [Chryseobacterium sp. SORGH_AS_1048]MDR6085896.1 lipopolysaccharide transport system permease protein [Chryseobacterium sp. SORGH_AS_0909]MDR6130263.1 lipopolysaccharide transport sys